MTTQEKLQAVTEQIRKDIPRLMELSDGCWVRKKRLMYPEFEENEYFYNHIRGVYQGDKSYILFSYDEDGEVGQSSIEKNYLDKHFEVVGHEPMLNDILEWFEKMRQLPEDTFFQDVFFQTNNGKYLEIYGDGGLITKWDLTKPYLKDQSDELINFLYKLKNNQL